MYKNLEHLAMMETGEGAWFVTVIDVGEQRPHIPRRKNVGEKDDKIIAVCANDPEYRHYTNIKELPPCL
ncbi:hypothetical protein MTR_1g112430 [Medicago truncatula]|uniref:inorganic diphosphatase n=1 Tax=Medicago truncatula TaxID=3880 RepID=A0A072VRR9_MEDTR|nr:hypothetical protein MTR_1g112430 [Medicago truncatula]